MRQIQQMNKKINVCLKNLDNITANTLNYFFTSKLSSQVSLSPHESGSDFLVIEYGKNLNINFLNQLTDNNQYAVILHMKPEEIEEHSRLFWVQKPIAVNDLMSAIKSIKQHITAAKTSKISQKANQSVAIETDLKSISQSALKNQNHKLSIITNHQTEKDVIRLYKDHKYVGSNQDTSMDDDQCHFLHPERYLYHYLINAIAEARKQKCSIVINTTEGDIFFNQKSQTFSHIIEEKHMMAMHSTPIFSNTKLTQTHQKPQFSGLQTEVFHKVTWVWESALLASKGRLPANTSMHTHVRMTRWPNFTRLQVFNHAIRIAAVWSRNKLSLFQTAKELNIPQRYVFSLYTAMNALGYVSVGKNESKEQLKSSHKSSLFSRIMNHIFTKKD